LRVLSHHDYERIEPTLVAVKSIALDAHSLRLILCVSKASSVPSLDFQVVRHVNNCARS